MRADRLLSLLWILRARGSVTASAAARELGVSVRTVLRDVEALSTTGVPVYCEVGRRGGIRLDPGFRTEVTGLTGAESAALVAALVPRAADDLGQRGPLDSALRKLTAALPRPAREEVDRVAQRVVVDLVGWLPAVPGRGLELLHRAVMEDRRVRIGYRGRGSGRTDLRRIDPWGLVCSSGAWYLAGSGESGVRFFHLLRNTAVELLDETFARPPDLDLRGLWDVARDDFRAAFTPLEAAALCRPERLAELAALVHVSADRADRARVDAGSDRVPVALRFSDRSHALQVVPAFGPDLLVLSPPDLCEELMAMAAGTAAAYAAVRRVTGASTSVDTAVNVNLC
ncbi:MAG TPA: WYL domain-containing protein [Actinotalea sp.]|nr:WYL domain-containing protein [Actinotalea sp.]